MQLKVVGLITVEGDAPELAMYTHALLNIFKLEHELMQEAQDEKDRELIGQAITDWMKAEFAKNETGHKEGNGAGDPEKRTVPEQTGNVHGKDPVGPAPEQRMENPEQGEGTEER